MAVASLQEDEYGIFQQTLADIITVFMQLQKVSQSQFDLKFESTRTMKLILRFFYLNTLKIGAGKVQPFSHDPQHFVQSVAKAQRYRNRASHAKAHVRS